MRALLLLILTATLVVCPLAQFIAPEPPPPTTLPTPISDPSPIAPTVSPPHVEISASATSLRVGETVTISGIPVNLGLPYYTLTLSSGGSATVTYDNQVRDALVADTHFEFVSALGEMNRVAFVLRAIAPGTVDANISATGEARSPEGAFMWSYGGSAPLTLTITE